MADKYIDRLKKGEYDDTHFYEYWNQSLLLFEATKGNYELFNKYAYLPPNQENTIKTGGYFYSTLLLRALVLENLIKARVLYQMKKEHIISKYQNLNDIISYEWKKYSHNPIKLCEKYEIELNDQEVELITNYLDFMDWAGRFPFPRSKNNIKSEQVLSGLDNEMIEALINRFSFEMELKANK